ncbi:MAG: hypothetical protein LC114_15295 [Bryobacterales bacterium]|nr:hypothetical protein [Bryobacterales bacterium]
MEKFLIFFFLFHGIAEAQRPANQRPGWERFKQVAANTGKLSVTLTLDRTEYLRGERMYATVVFENATSTPLEVFEPLSHDNTSIELLWRITDPERARIWGEWENRAQHGGPIAQQAQTRNMMDLRPTRILVPGERIEVRTDMCVDALDPSKSPIRHGSIHSALLPPGEYRFVLVYGPSPMAPFRILKTTPTKIYAVNRIPNRILNGEEHPCYGVVVLAVEAEDGNSYVVAQETTYDCEKPFQFVPSGAMTQGSFRWITPFTRIAASSEPITSFQLRNYGERVEISWKTTSGRAERRMVETATMKVEQ